MSTEAFKTVIPKLSDLQNYIGKEIGISEWIEITQDRIDSFGEVTEDMQWIHVNPEMSRKHSPYKTTVAHGFLVLSLGPKITYETMQIQNVAMGVNYGLNKVRFTSATPVGAFVRGKITLSEYKEIPGGARYTMQITFEIKGQEKPACVAEWIGQAYATPDGKPAKAVPAKTETVSSPEDTILYERVGKVGVITFNRPDYYNAMDSQMKRLLIETLMKAQNDSKARALVITGNGRGFSAGADLLEMTNGSITKHDVQNDLFSTYSVIVKQIVEMDKPVIAAINGTVAGAAIVIALACDYKIMAAEAKLRYAFINIGLVPDAGSTWFLAREVGYTKAMEIITGGEKIPAVECLEMGLVNATAPTEHVLQTAMALAEKLADGPTNAIGRTKKVLHYAMNHDLYQTMNEEARQQKDCIFGYDHREGTDAFLQKRSPRFIGK